MSGGRYEIRSPHDPDFGYKEDVWTESQERAWAYWQNRTRLYHKHINEHGFDPAPPPVRLAMLGGKGSGKTYLGAMLAAWQVQKYPGSLGMFASGTFPQVNKNISPHFREVLNHLGVKFTYHNKKTIRGRVYDKVFVIHLSRNVKSFVCLTSFENMETIEGSEWDWQVYTEIQAADREKFEVAIARLRSKKANRAVYVDGLPANADHWQYQVLEEDLQFNLYEPSLHENVHNVGEDYLDMLMRLYDKQKAQAYIEGRRISLQSDAVFYAFDYKRHVKSEMARALHGYVPDRELIVSFDFNMRPMSVSLWQPKSWLDEGAEEARTIYAQVDEFEVWDGGTPGTLEQIMARYGEHSSGGIVLGDSSGRQRHSAAPGQTDWKLIKEAMAGMYRMKVRPGLIRRGTDTDGRVTYSNPNVRDTVIRANGLLMNAKGEQRVTFLPESKFESGGVWRSVSRVKFTPDGKIDKSMDKKEARSAPRSHFSDTFRYMAYHVTGGERSFTKESAQNMMKAGKEAIMRGSNHTYAGKRSSTSSYRKGMRMGRCTGLTKGKTRYIL